MADKIRKSKHTTAEIDAAVDMLLEMYTRNEINNLLDQKVNASPGMGLSTNDFTDADKSKLDGLENYSDTTIKADIAKAAEQTALNRSTLGYQIKNLLVNNCKTTTKHGVTATVNDDKSITFTGANTIGATMIFFWNIQTGSTVTNYTGNKKWLPNGKYIVSGGHDGVTVQVRWSENNTADAGLAASTNGSEPVFNVTDAHKYVWSRIHIAADADFGNGVTIYPMIRPADITDDTYEPYKPSVEERLAALEEKLAAQEGGVT